MARKLELRAFLDEFLVAVLGSRRGIAELTGDARFREMIETLPAAIYLTDAGGRIIYYNESAAAMWGRRPEIGKDQWCGAWKVYRPDGTLMPLEECPIVKTLKSGAPSRGTEAIVERPDGTRVPFVPYPTPLFNAEGQLAGAVSMLLDITERNRAEEVGRRLAAIVESSDDAIVSKTLGGIITTWNGAAERVFGYTAEEAIGQPIFIIIPPGLEEEEREIIERVGRGERVDHFETRRRRKDGSLFHISVTISPLKDAHGRIIGASKIGRDITDRKRAEERQRMLVRELHHRTKNMFAVVQSIVARGLEGHRSAATSRELVLGRLQALAHAYAKLDETGWGGAQLADVVASELVAFADWNVEVDGPPVLLSAQAAQSFALVIHELVTNAAKHGALSVPEGRLRVHWTLTGTGPGATFHFRWKEQDGPAPQPVGHRGFGTTVLERLIRDDTSTPPKIDFAPDGMAYELRVALDSIAARPWQPYPESVDGF